MADKMMPSMVPLVDKPFVQHLVEYLIQNGVNEIDFVLSSLPEQAEGLFGDGSRWGVTFRYSLVKDGSRPYKAVAQIARAMSGPVLIVHDDAIVSVPSVADFVQGSSHPVILMDSSRPHGASVGWTGWASCDARLLDHVPNGTRDDLFRYLSSTRVVLQYAGTVLRITSFRDMIQAQIHALNRRFSDLALSGNRCADNIVLGAGARIHQTVEIVGPVYVGENAEICEGVKLGPGTVIGRDCVVDTGTRISESIVLSGTYVGKELDVILCWVDRSNLYNARLSAGIKLTDRSLLGPVLHLKIVEQLSRYVSRVACGCALALLSPILLAVAGWVKATRRGPVFIRRRSVSIPASTDPREWCFFDRISFIDSEAQPLSELSRILLIDLPGLFNVARGEMNLVGTPARTAAEIYALEPDWRTLYLRSKAGLVTESRVRHAEPDEEHAFEAFYAINSSLRYDLHILFDYVLRRFRVRASE